MQEQKSMILNTVEVISDNTNSTNKNVRTHQRGLCHFGLEKLRKASKVPPELNHKF